MIGTGKSQTCLTLSRLQDLTEHGDKMAKQQMTLDDIELVKRLVRAEFKELVEVLDEVSATNLKAVGKTTDFNTHNIMKLQAQITAIKESLIEKGIVSRQRLNERENEALEKIEKMSMPQGVAA